MIAMFGKYLTMFLGMALDIIHIVTPYTRLSFLAVWIVSSWYELNLHVLLSLTFFHLERDKGREHCCRFQDPVGLMCDAVRGWE